jgi:hypothetical protein
MLCGASPIPASSGKTEGLSKRELIRCLKRYIAREVFTARSTERSTQHRLTIYRSVT